MELAELKRREQTDAVIDERGQNIYCTVCDCKRHQIITTFDQFQRRACEGTRTAGKHNLFYDSRGKYLYAVEHLSGKEDWRDGIDHARTEGVTPQSQAWETDERPRRTGGRKPEKPGKTWKGGRWTRYVNPDGKE